jgi:hypothetical protein
MKVISRVLVVGLFVASGATAAFAQAQQAYSVNSIGAIKKTIPAQSRVALGIPLVAAASTSNGVAFGDTAVASALPTGSSVAFWDAEQQIWSSVTKSGKNGWGAYQDRFIAEGEAFFAQNASSEDVSVLIQGEVPTAPSISRQIAGGGGTMEMAVNPYPVSVTLGDMGLAETLPVGSTVAFWDVEDQAWITVSKSGKNGWGAYLTMPVSAAEGFFIQSQSNLTWTESKPYTWPAE